MKLHHKAVLVLRGMLKTLVNLKIRGLFQAPFDFYARFALRGALCAGITQVLYPNKDAETYPDWRPNPMLIVEMDMKESGLLTGFISLGNLNIHIKDLSFLSLGEVLRKLEEEVVLSETLELHGIFVKTLEIFHPIHYVPQASSNQSIL